MWPRRIVVYMLDLFVSRGYTEANINSTDLYNTKQRHSGSNINKVPSTHQSIDDHSTYYRGLSRTGEAAPKKAGQAASAPAPAAQVVWRGPPPRVYLALTEKIRISVKFGLLFIWSSASELIIIAYIFSMSKCIRLVSTHYVE